MKIAPGLILQHGTNGPPTLVAEWAGERGLEVVVHDAWRDAFPDPSGYGFVVSLGSEHSATATDPAWIPDEVAMLRGAVNAGVPVLGICFGGQALSVALGGWSDPLPSPEIGWIAIESDDVTVPRGPWLQYHSELMRVPPGAHELARSPAGAAAFRKGPHLGLQFHPEVDAELVDQWARADPNLSRSGVTPEDLAAQSAVHAEPGRERAFALFDGWRRTALV